MRQAVDVHLSSTRHYPMTDSMPGSNPAAAPNLEGYVLAGRYRITRLIGEGGMGVVYEGEHIEIGKRLAIKLVHAVHAQHSEIIARFKREARSASAIESEHIIQIFDVGHDERAGLFLVMELLRGMDLRDFLTVEERLDPLAASCLILQATRGLVKAHAAGIVHRDLKPANIFLTNLDDGSARVKLVDFGVAKVLRDVSPISVQSLTRSGTVVGTAQYMSPEQAQGLASIDHRSDIYSLGAVFYEMLVGMPAVPSYSAYEQTIVHIATREAPRVSHTVSGIDPKLDSLVADMLQNTAATRIQNMGHVRERLLEVYPHLDDVRVKLSHFVKPDTFSRRKEPRDACLGRSPTEVATHSDERSRVARSGVSEIGSARTHKQTTGLSMSRTRSERAAAGRTVALGTSRRASLAPTWISAIVALVLGGAVIVVHGRIVSDTPLLQGAPVASSSLSARPAADGGARSTSPEAKRLDLGEAKPPPSLNIGVTPDAGSLDGASMSSSASSTSSPSAPVLSPPTPGVQALEPPKRPIGRPKKQVGGAGIVNEF